MCTFMCGRACDVMSVIGWLKPEWLCRSAGGFYVALRDPSLPERVHVAHSKAEVCAAEISLFEGERSR